MPALGLQDQMSLRQWNYPQVIESVYAEAEQNKGVSDIKPSALRKFIIMLLGNLW